MLQNNTQFRQSTKVQILYKKLYLYELIKEAKSMFYKDLAFNWEKLYEMVNYYLFFILKTVLRIWSYSNFLNLLAKFRPKTTDALAVT